MLCTTQSGLHATQRPATPGAEPWRADLEALRRLLQDSRPAEPSRGEIADLIEDEAPGALPRRARERIAERLTATLRRLA
ncbi:hypothetical protein M446_1997 [Methylobacterium sp. 4-46]|uniref:hypothetical protein n=1 Tax=unclassified Methylobacterium TaxID=2615210 RepID=UPI000152E070|nr:MULTISPECIES: hypothetical protein [Methylobacterium]ACA16462.1 hypothetical protein M446_1997 [Methylobacterium sp. 4-46]WFT82172.1 hypothetical protein QA634_10125 [Methylobacterium nodulans]